MPAIAIATETNIRVHSTDAECSPSFTASTAAVANDGSSHASNPRKLSLNQDHAFGTPSQPATTLPIASTVSGTVMDLGDSWTCASTSGAIRGFPQNVMNISRHM